MQVGKTATLTVDQIVDYGFFLVSDFCEKILLHNNDTDRSFSIGEKVEVFIFNDKHGKLAATTVIPKMIEGNYEWAKVVSINKPHGVFVSVGLSKDILVSDDDLPKIPALYPQVGDKLLVTLKVDNSNRLFARLATEQLVLNNCFLATPDMLNKPFNATVYRSLKVGAFALTDDFIRCFIHESERVFELRVGEEICGRVIGITKDKDINGSLLPRKHERLNDDAKKIYNYLVEHSGQMPYNDKSTPEEIKKRFFMSKAAFKRGLGTLMKEGKITQSNGITRILK